MTTLSVTTEELDRAGIEYRIERNKHFKIKANGLPTIVCSVTTSDRRSEFKARSLVRRLIRGREQS
jgi:hypothetical protein